MDTDAPVPAAPAAAAMDTDAPAPAPAPARRTRPPASTATAAPRRPPWRVRLQTDGEADAPLATMDTPEGAEVRRGAAPIRTVSGRGFGWRRRTTSLAWAPSRARGARQLVIGVYNMGRKAIAPEHLKVVAAPLPKVVEKKPETKPKPKPPSAVNGCPQSLGAAAKRRASLT